MARFPFHGRVVLFALLSSLASQSIRAQTVPDSLTEKLDLLLAPWDSPGRPGVAAVVVEKGKVVYAKGFGLADLEHAVPVTSSTVFDLGSVSKHVTAFAVLMLESQGLQVIKRIQ